jgi:alpha-mannosidase
MPGLLAHPDYTRERVRQVARRASALVHADARAPDRVRIAGPVDRIPISEVAGLDHRDATPGMELGPLWATWWLAVEGIVPAEWEGEQVDLLLVTNSEATLWLDGEPVQGLVSGGYLRPDAMLAARAVAGEELSARVEIACNGLFGWSELHPQPHQAAAAAPPFRLERCELARFDGEAWALSSDLGVLVALMDEPGADDAWRGELLRELNRFCNAWDAEDRVTWPVARAILGPLLSERRNATRTHEITAIGHAHIDTAWLWPLEETFRKCVRTFATQVRLMERYPAYRFACSQAQQYAWIRDRAPGLWARIRERVAGGQWLPVGGTWIEPDCNLPAGESLVRQFVYGQRFFERELGRRARVFWNPDVFGYNGQLPQIMRGAGIDGFLTQKLSWNRFNPSEHHTFRWVGIDGSAVLAHFPPADTYNAEATVPELRRAAREFKDHALSARSLLVFGWGDGGGGPTPQMLETLARVEDLQGVPRTTIGDPEAFFAELGCEAGWPEVVGELYLEYHRGTYTTQARTKRASRRAERALHDAELLAAVSGEPWPRSELEPAWQTLLLNHFHDILPGSSIGEVHARAERDLAEVEAAAGAVRDRLVRGEVVNTVGVARREVVSVGGVLRFAQAPSCGVGRLVEGRSEVRVSESADGFALGNEHLRAVLGRDGTLRSLVELGSGREALAAPGNVLELYEDRPTAFEAWDLDPFHLETRTDCPGATAAELVLADSLRAEVAFERPIGRASRMRQTVRLDAESARLEFRCAIDWHEDRRALKVRFPVAVRAPRATYEMQFGVVERPTHYSTRRDLAQYEVPGHRFADLSEHGFGVALLSAATYGWSVHAGDMRMTLLRSPRWPDPEADIGRHELSFAIHPHAGSWQDAGVTAQALCFNAPLLLGEPRGETRSWFSTDTPALLVDTVKRAEDTDDLIVRLYEAHGGRGVARLRVGLPFTEAWFANLLEDRLAAAEVDGGEVLIPFRPFEIVTLALGRP